MPRGYAPSRVDENQKSIVELWRKMGASVLLLHQVGGECPDALLGYNFHNVLVEIKDGRKAPSARKLTASQQALMKKWKGQICIIKNEEEAINLIYTMRSWNAPEPLLQRFDND